MLLVDDSANDVELTLTALEKHQFGDQVDIARDGSEALDYLYRRGAFADRPPGNPVLILLDIKMPKVDGLEVLRQVRADPALRLTPVVMLTSSRERRDVEQSYQLGANAYVVKSVDFGQFVEAVRELGLFWLVHNEPPPALGY
jgi:CheY-like chemotaxis protein